MSARLAVAALLAALLTAPLSACGGGAEPSAEQLAAEQARHAEQLAAEQARHEQWMAANSGRSSTNPPPCDAQPRPEQCQ